MCERSFLVASHARGCGLTAARQILRKTADYRSGCVPGLNEGTERDKKVRGRTSLTRLGMEKANKEGDER